MQGPLGYRVLNSGDDSNVRWLQIVIERPPVGLDGGGEDVRNQERKQVGEEAGGTVSGLGVRFITTTDRSCVSLLSCSATDRRDNSPKESNFQCVWEKLGDAFTGVLVLAAREQLLHRWAAVTSLKEKRPGAQVRESHGHPTVYQ
ncbi:unnamed protein product [Pleuronectes platessa]|uniref:Uncharacterized protein n=1 Tax=Pleuronectes platessa TaxID=8262 RepID=A0A9N7VB05_PLEPL|nr:unnamed protein product [Pleuronectes platessa]